MPKFSDSSIRKLHDCHPELQDLMEEVIKHFDITILEGYRSPGDQQKAYDTGRSNLKPGQSKHNASPSRAIDIAPWRPENPHIDWNNIELFRFMGGFVLGIASQMGIKIRWGGDWDEDFNFKDQNLVDLPHFELMD
jgi:peptidoglycan L-alanyl-D-glutamate endopeptidase CwlK